MLRSVLSVLLGFGLAACGSDPLRTPAEEGDDAGRGGNTAGSGRGGMSAAGRGGSTGGTSAGSAGNDAGGPPVPDYTLSPCYGQAETTEVYDLGSHDVNTVTATCRGEGNRTLFYVADDLWETEYAPGAPPFTQADVDAFLYAYELTGHAGSAYPELGILPADELVFGALDEAGLTNGKLPIFLISSGGAGQGYLCSWCARLELHLDGPLLRSLRTDEALSIAAHETVHAIHRGLDSNESIWVDESLAEAAMTLNGYFTDGEWLSGFLHDTNQRWGPGVTEISDFNYGAGLLFGSYLWERGGAELLGAVTREPQNDWAGIDAALASVGAGQDGWQLFLDMAMAVALDDEASGYHFASFDLGEGPAAVSVETGSSLNDTVEESGLVYVALSGDARGFTVDSSAPVTARIALSGDPTQIADVAPGVPFDFDRPARALLLTSPEPGEFTLSVR
ncbi:MAG TPA: hypothetical protein VGK73_31950 [Polyangiaceae bacterium]